MSLTLAINNNQTQAQAYKTIENHYRTQSERLVKRYSVFLHSKERAEDTVQEAYVRALTYWSDAPSDPTEFARWFSAIIGNALKDNHRDEIRKGATSERPEEDEGYEGPAIPAIIYRQVKERIAAKPEAHSRILSLALLQQYRPAEIGQLTRETQVNIRQVVSRFRKEIKTEFGWEI
jgi:RNA polymerase sigma factor (sigma-70 family)